MTIPDLGFWIASGAFALAIALAGVWGRALHQRLDALGEKLDKVSDKLGPVYEFRGHVTANLENLNDRVTALESAARQEKDPHGRQPS